MRVVNVMGYSADRKIRENHTKSEIKWGKNWQNYGENDQKYRGERMGFQILFIV